MSTRTEYQIEERRGDNQWYPVGKTFETKTLAEIICASTMANRTTRVVAVSVPTNDPCADGCARGCIHDRMNKAFTNPAPLIPARLSDSEKSAGIAMIKRLADDLTYEQANYAATLESIVIAARRLFDDHAKRIGRGYRDGVNTACPNCDGVYPKEDK